MIKHTNQRVAVFIDVQNMYYSARNLFNAKVNFGAIVKAAVADRNLVRAIAYVVSTKTGEEKPFFEALEKVGIQTKEKELQEFFGGAKKADWDVGMAVDMIKLASKVDAIILVSGDGDFESVLEYVSNTYGCLVEVMAFGETTSSKLRDIADEFVDLSDDKEQFLIGAGARREIDSNGGEKSKTGLRGRPRYSLKDL